MRAAKLMTALGLVVLGVGTSWWFWSRQPAAVSNAVPAEAPAEAATTSTVRENHPPTLNSTAVQPAIENPAARMAAPIHASPEANPPGSSAELQRMAKQLAQDRRKIVRLYGPVFDQLQLTTDEREKLTQLLVNFRAASIDYASATATTGVDPLQDRETSQLSIASIRDGIQQQIKALLGDEKYREFLVADEAARQEGVVARLQNNLQSTGETLTDEQQAKLREVMRALKLNHVTADLVDQASGFLSPAQLAGLQKIQQERTRGLTKPPIQNAIRENLPPASGGH
jgi:hypothetical protein